jgi:hypothetical protein
MLIPGLCLFVKKAYHLDNIAFCFSDAPGGEIP